MKLLLTVFVLVNFFSTSLSQAAGRSFDQQACWKKFKLSIGKAMTHKMTRAQKEAAAKLSRLGFVHLTAELGKQLSERENYEPAFAGVYIMPFMSSDLFEALSFTKNWKSPSDCKVQVEDLNDYFVKLNRQTDMPGYVSSRLARYQVAEHFESLEEVRADILPKTLRTKWTQVYEEDSPAEASH